MRTVELELQSLAEKGVLVKVHGTYVANPELFGENLQDARHIRRMRSIIIGAAKKLERMGHVSA